MTVNKNVLVLVILYVAVIVTLLAGIDVIVVLDKFTFATFAVSPIHATNVCPEGGALAEIVIPVVPYDAEVMGAELSMAEPLFTVNAYMLEKFAVMVILELTITDRGLAVPVAPPDHPEKK